MLLIIGVIVIAYYYAVQIMNVVMYVGLAVMALLITYAIVHGSRKPVEEVATATQFEIDRVEGLMKQLGESVAHINQTTVTETFFKRLHFSLDLLLELQKYEKYNLFKNSTPTQDYEKIINNLEATVNDFIDRSIIAHVEKNEHLKEEKTKDQKLYKHISSMLLDFEESNRFWQGNGMFPHYSGLLYTEANYQRLKDMYDDLFQKVEHI